MKKTAIKVRKYESSDVRRLKQRIKDIELENADLRNRCSRMYHACVTAEKALYDMSIREGTVQIACNNLIDAVRNSSVYHAEKPRMAISAALAAEAENFRDKSRYVADRNYANGRSDLNYTQGYIPYA